METRAALVKEWIIDKAQETAMNYNTFIDYERNEAGTRQLYNGSLKVLVDEIISETEKAVQVRVSTGAVLGSCKGWKLWVPKSCISFVD